MPPPGSARDGFLGTNVTLEHGLTVLTAAVLDPRRTHRALAVLSLWREAVIRRPGGTEVLVHLRIVADVLEGYPVPARLSRQVMGPFGLLDPLRARLEALHACANGGETVAAADSNGAAA